MDSIEATTLTATQLINRFISNSYELKSTIESYPKEVKGNIFEEFIAELYRGNGWLANVVGGRNDGGADILLYLPSSPDVVSFIIQTKNHAKPLTYDETKIELIKFEEKGKQIHSCSSYKLIATNGFVKEAEKLERFNMGLYGWQHIEELIESYGKHKEPHLELLAHNKIAFHNTEELFKNNNRVCVVQATGTGKRFIIGKLLLSHIKEDCLFVSPSSHINTQQELLLPFLKNVKYLTYQSLLGKSEKQLEKLDADLIIFDEFHRLGASEWGAAANRLLTIKSSSKVFGATATHIRHLDNNRNMSEELFNNVISNQLPLAEAIARRILPAPKYICSLYNTNNQINEIQNEVRLSKETDDNKSNLLRKLHNVKIDWENTSGIANILNKNLSNLFGKYIIFCEDKYHLSEMIEEVRKWFKKAARIGKKGIIEPDHYIVHSDMATSDVNTSILKFELADINKNVHLMFSINMFNEGLHLKNVNRIILLRKTISPLVYFQQIGRCLKTDNEEQPIIFDLVNNTENIKSNDIETSFKHALSEENSCRKKHNLQETHTSIEVIDETKEFLSIINEIRNRLVTFEVGLSYLKDYFNELGHSNVPQHYKDQNTQFALGYWCGNLRQRYKKQRLTPDQISQVNNLSFVWDIIEEQWQYGVSQLKQYRNCYGNCDVPQRFKSHESDFGIGNWCVKARIQYRNNQLTQDKIQQLEDLGFVWNLVEEIWKVGLEELVFYKKQYKNSNVPAKYINKESGFLLGSWCSKRRESYKKDELEQNKIDILNNLGFIWNVFEHQMKLGISELTLYKKKHDNCNPPSNYKSILAGFNLTHWCNNIRKKFNNNELGQVYIEQLDLLGFIWEPIEELWKNAVSELINYKNKHGNCEVPADYKTPISNFNLGSWCGKLRKKHQKGKLDNNRIEQINSLGFIWDLEEKKWQEGFKELQLYKSTHGESIVPTKYCNPVSNFKLGNWCGTQKKNFKKGTLLNNKIVQLEELGFVWDTIEHTWQQTFNVLNDFINETGHCSVPRNYINSKTGIKLSSWCVIQREKLKQGLLKQDKIDKLDSIDFVWNPYEDKWQFGLEELKLYITANGNSNVTTDYIMPSGFKLGNWCSNRRKSYFQGKLEKDKAEQLKQLGFLFDPLKIAAEIGLNELRRYKQQFGHCNVPVNYKSPKSGGDLRSWCDDRRKAFSKGKLNKAIEKELVELGFIFNPLEQFWLNGLSELTTYKEQFGDCDIPQKYVRENSEYNLGKWCSTIRKSFNDNLLSTEKVQKLEQLGFIWDVHEYRWNNAIIELKQFKESYGHCNVKSKYITPITNFKLGSWCSVRRKNFHNGKLETNKVIVLEKIGFDFKK